MIRFTCSHCREPVRVADSFGGKKGRCPSCKEVVSIPLAWREEPFEASPLAEAIEDDSAPPPPPPPPPAPGAGDPSESDLPLAGDPRFSTVSLQELNSPIRLAGEDEPAAAGPAPPAQAAPPDPPPREQKPMPLVLIAAAGVVALLAVAGMVLLLVYRPWEVKPQLLSRPPRPAATASTPATPPAKVAAAPASPTFPLSSEILEATARAPDGTVGVLHVNLETAGTALGSLPKAGDSPAAAVARSRYWADLDARIGAGGAPRSFTLFITGEIAPLAEGLGRLRPAGDAGAWSVFSADAKAPHFLLRVTGHACQKLAQSLAARAGGSALPEGKPMTAGLLRLSGPGLAAADELLLGTVKTIDDSGASVINAQKQRRLRDLLAKVPTDRPIVGCFLVERLRGLVNGATGSAEPAAAWADGSTSLVFSIDPRSKGQAVLLVNKPAASALANVAKLVEPMTVREEEGAIRITGSNVEGIKALAEMLPGLRRAGLKVLELAQPEPPPQPAPTPPIASTSASAPVVASAPAEPPKPVPPPQPVEELTLTCLNEKCSSAKTGFFKLDKSKVPANTAAGTEPMTCPHCNELKAVLARQCAKCKKWYPAISGDACPYCAKAEEAKPKPAPPRPPQPPRPPPARR